MPNLVGQQLGNYKLMRLLGEGGFAEVYLGEHVHLGTQAAIKVLHTQLTSDEIANFRTEARTVARLVHPNIVRVLDFGVEGKTPYLVMDYAANGTLRQRYPRGTKVPLVAIVSYVTQIADALQYAHDKKLIHRDIKPENMLVGSRNEIWLSDFGIALIAQSSRYQNTQEVAGTVAYMAPEQIQGKPRPASDQYSLAVVVYEWLSKERPFKGSFTEIATQHVLAPPPPLREKDPTIKPDVELVIMTALAKDPKERFGSVQDFAAALERASHSSQPAKLASTYSTPLPTIPSSPRPTIMPTKAVSSQPSLPTKGSSPHGSIVTSAHRSRGFKPKYVIGILLYLILADLLRFYEKSWMVNGHVEKLLASIGPLPIYTSTILFLFTLVILVVILVYFDLFPHRMTLLRKLFRRDRS